MLVNGRIMLVAGLALCVVGVAIAVATAVTGHHHGSPRAQFAGPTMPPNLPAADFTLPDQDG
ncbi:MAG: hypothetical protein QOG68_1589, partial [Solirubrobacteraceae bacterium]|nr:hypothetical protein [Solirubrobacteraceae bacterium]